jgi:hypothetical protein
MIVHFENTSKEISNEVAADIFKWLTLPELAAIGPSAFFCIPFQGRRLKAVRELGPQHIENLCELGHFESLVAQFAVNAHLTHPTGGILRIYSFQKCGWQLPSPWVAITAADESSWYHVLCLGALHRFPESLLLRLFNALTVGEIYLDQCCACGSERQCKLNTALEWASKHGFVDFVRFLISTGAEPRAHNHCAFLGAARNGHLEIVRSLARSVADVSWENNEAIHQASESGHLEVVRLLIGMGAPVADSLIWAANGGHLETVQFLAELTPHYDPHFVTALLYASGQGHLNVVEYLVSSGVDYRAYIDSALFRARGNGHKKVTNYLVSIGATPAWTIFESLAWVARQIGRLRKRIKL